MNRKERFSHVSGYLGVDFIAKKKKRLKIFYAVVIVLVVAGSIFWGVKLDQYIGGLKGYGLLGLFLLAFMVNATVIFPAPIFIFPFAVSLAHSVDPFSVSVAFALGATLGEGIGYLVGFTGRRLMDSENPAHQQVERWLKGRSFWKRNSIIFVLTIVPFFPFDIVGLAAGILRYPFGQFFCFCLTGRFVKYFIVVIGGVEILDAILRLWGIR